MVAHRRLPPVFHHRLSIIHYLMVREEMQIGRVGPDVPDPAAGRATAEIGSGKLVLLRTDGESGHHFVAAARIVSAETIATMLRDAAGMPMLALPPSRCEALELERIGGQASGREMLTTFEARTGVTTGISAADRARTMRVAADPRSGSADIVTPGHVVPIRVNPHSLLTEGPSPEASALELVEAAGHGGGAVLCQVMDAAGNPAGAPDAAALASKLGIQLVDQTSVLLNQLRKTVLVSRVTAEMVSTAVGVIGCVTFLETTSGRRHFALSRRLNSGPAIRQVLVREQDPIRDMVDLGSTLLGDLELVATRDDVAMLYLSPTAPQGEETAESQDPKSRTLIRAEVTRQMLGDLGIVAVVASRSGPHPLPQDPS
jgi:3,4-dihydroxy 2-butanone 4-phosphate synthase/GTP cyclohydrolase II